MGWVVRYGDRELPLAEGTHLVGRDSTCTIALDDELVSPRHAMFVVTPDGMSVRDLGTKNGVLLKYCRLSSNEEARLSHGDTCLIGATNLIFLKKRTGRLRTIQEKLSDAHDAERPAITGGALLHERFLAEADRAWAQGNLDRFATATHLLLEALGGALRDGRTDDAALVSATRHALRLAELRGVDWIDQLLMLYDALLLVPSIDTITSMQRLFGANHWRSERLDRYVDRIGPVLTDAGPRGRALLGQLESLRRLQA